MVSSLSASAKAASPMIANLAQKVAVVTGGAAGKCISDVNPALPGGCERGVVYHSASLAAELGDRGLYVPCDVSSEADIANLVQTAVKEYGKIDVFHNNCGVGGRQGREGLIENVDTDDFDRVMEINLRGALLGMKHAARAMKGRDTRGCIINTASIAGLRVQLNTLGPPVYLPAGYTASKHALIGITKLGACELAPWGIRVNAVAPEIQRVMEDNSVLEGVALLPEDIANAVVFLASDKGRCVNGHTLVVDLGVTVGVSGELTLVPGTLT
ncbi:hypothetical protein N2152v2_009713 [Parachlorella kessleri]